MATAADVLALQTRINEVESNLSTAIDFNYISIHAIGILSMQIGFTIFELSAVRTKNVKSVSLKNLADFAFGSIVWWLVGAGLASGESKFLGGKNADFVTEDASGFAYWILGFGFAATAATIVSGSVLGRMRFWVYMILTQYVIGFVYPLAAHWAWAENGFLGAYGYKDFAGGVVVHTTGGVVALLAAWMAGPRRGKFVLRAGRVVSKTIKGHAPAWSAVGAMFLFVGWFSFNGGSAGTLHDGGVDVAGRAMMNTLLSASAAACVAVLWGIAFRKLHDLQLMVNGLLAGLVGITAPCGYLSPWAALAVGASSVLIYLAATWWVEKVMHVDDVVEAFAVHGACGVWGAVLLGLFDLEEGLFYGGGGSLLLAQLVGCGAIVTMSLVTGALFLVPIHLTAGLSVSDDDQLVGLDVKYHDGYAFPEFDAEQVRQFNNTRAVMARMQAAKGKYEEEDPVYESEASDLRRRGSTNPGAMDRVKSFMGAMGKKKRSKDNLKDGGIPSDLLEDVLNDPVAAAELKNSLKAKFEAAESVDFWVKTSSFEKTRNRNKRIKLAKDIIQSFVTDDAKLQVNLRSDTKSRLVALFRSGDEHLGARGLFRKAKAEVKGDLQKRAETKAVVQTHFARMIESATYDLESNGGRVVSYDMRSEGLESKDESSELGSEAASEAGSEAGSEEENV